MRSAFGRLPFIGRRSNRGGRSSDEAAIVRAPVDPDLAPLGPPVLLPRAIVRQLVFDATELVPAWAMRRPEIPQAVMPDKPTATKRPRRPKSTETPPARPATAARRSRTRKPSDDPQPRS